MSFNAKTFHVASVYQEQSKLLYRTELNDL
jgi:hypothetical protein